MTRLGKLAGTEIKGCLIPPSFLLYDVPEHHLRPVEQADRSVHTWLQRSNSEQLFRFGQSQLCREATAMTLISSHMGANE